MEHALYAPTLLETARLHIAALFDAYQAATGHRATFMAQVINGDRAFASRYLQNGINITTYDQFVGRMSAIWPATSLWPDGVPRPAPVPLDETGAALLADREAKRSAQAVSTGLTVEDWPTDIPQPTA